MSDPETPRTAHHIQDNRGANIGTQINTTGPSPDNLASLTARALPYLRDLAKISRRLPLRGLDPAANEPAADGIGIDSVYIALDTKRQRPPTGRDEGERKTYTALAAVIEFPRVVLLGDPGSGKTTFLSHLAYCLAEHHLDPGKRSVARLPGWDPQNCPIPVLIVLRRFVAWVKEHSAANGNLPAAGTQPVWDYFKAQLAPISCLDCAEAIEKAVAFDNGVLFIFDGLDEVPTDELRVFVRDCAAAFDTRYPHAAMILTCRTIPYQKKKWQLPGITDFELAPFDEGRIDAFIDAWFTAHRVLGGMDPNQAERKGRQLKQVLHEPSRVELGKLAQNPMLLTVMALLQATDRELPEKRADLYKEVVDLLLRRWDATRSDDGTLVCGVADLMRQAGRDMNDLHDLLASLAWTAQVACKNLHAGDAVADLPRGDLHKALVDIHPDKDHDPYKPWGWANLVVETIQERSGLLLATREDVFQFPHRSFQEFLAAGTLLAHEDFPENVLDLVDESGYWREVIKWAVGRATHCDNRASAAISLVETLSPLEGAADALRWKAWWLAGECLLEMGRAKAEKTTRGKQLVQRVIAALVALVERGALLPKERAEAAAVLGQLGDPRPGVGCQGGVPVFRWSAEIPAGDFTMGGDPDAYDGREERQRRILAPYRMSLYPVTVEQFAAFVNAGGYRDKKFWTPKGREWREEQKVSGPEDSRPEFQTPNHPRIGVSWYEAMAFCKWLNGTFTTEQLGIGQGQIIRLPTEAEWERVARGGGKNPRKFPWGDEHTGEELTARCNWGGGEINSTSAVGIFPAGITKDTGITDLAGNVWEWCQSRWDDESDKASEPAEDLDSNSTGVLRGGSWFHGLPDGLRAACRSGNGPGDCNGNVGFRVVCGGVAR